MSEWILGPQDEDEQTQETWQKVNYGGKPSLRTANGWLYYELPEHLIDRIIADHNAAALLERVRMKVALIAARVSPASSILPRAVDIEALAEAALADLDALLGEAK